MKKPVLSFHTRIVLIFFFLLVLAVLFTRTFFLDSFNDYLRRTEPERLTNSLEKLYQKYSLEIPADTQESFATDLENLLRQSKESELTRDLYSREVAVYSIYIFIFILILTLLLFFISVQIIARPLKYLLNATGELRSGNLDIRLKEHRFSPLNDLTVSFNSMIAELSRSRAELVEAEKKLLWREIARVMAHEIKNPLTPIRLSMERLEMKHAVQAADFDNVFRESVRIVSEEVRNLENLVTRFRDFAALPQIHPELFNIVELIKDVATLYQDRHHISIISDPELPELFADKLQIRQVFINLVTNAVQAARVRAEIDIAARYSKEFLICSIRDQGTGIDPDNLKKIFEPYFTTKRKGTGLGLGIVKGIIENHGGTIIAESSLGSGTEFIINLPVIKDQSL